MIIAFIGDNAPVREQAAKEFVSGFTNIHGNVAVDRFIGEEVEASALNDALSTMPFLSPRRMVVVRDLSANKTLAEDFEKIAKSIAVTTDFVLIEGHIDNRSRYLKSLMQVADVREFANLDGEALINWVVDFVRSLGGKISQRSAEFLVDRIGTNHQLLSTELKKLVLYDPTVTTETIQLLTAYSPKSSVFAMLDAALAGDVSKALKLYAEQRSQGMEPQAILGMITWQLHILSLVKTAGDMKPSEIAKTTKLNPFVVRKNQSNVNRITLGKLASLLERAINTDRQMKSSPVNPDDAVQTLIMAF
jgi:DNA polymerase-3 subunit delta